MTDETANLILAHLRDIRGDIAALRDDIADLKYRVSSLEQQVAAMKLELAHLRGDLAHYSLRQDQHDERLHRIERQLELND